MRKELKVIIDEPEGEFVVGRTEYDISEVDSVVLISTDQKLKKEIL